MICFIASQIKRTTQPSRPLGYPLTQQPEGSPIFGDCIIEPVLACQSRA